MRNSAPPPGKRSPLGRGVLERCQNDPIFFSTHSEIAEYYKHEPGVHPAQSTTLDYVVAATAG